MGSPPLNWLGWVLLPGPAALPCRPPRIRTVCSLLTPSGLWAPGSPHQCRRRARIQWCSTSEPNRAQEERILFPTSQDYRQCDLIRNTRNQRDFKKQNQSHRSQAGSEMKTQSSELAV